MTKTQQKYSHRMVNDYPQYNNTFPASFVQASWNIDIFSPKHGVKRSSQLIKRMAKWYGVK